LPDPLFSSYTSDQMRLLAIDFGARRIGTAVSDELGLTTRPVETIRCSRSGQHITRLKELVDELEVEGVVIGVPLMMDGSVGEAAARVIGFADRLKEEIAVPVFTQDERLTSWDAEQVLAENGVRHKQRRERSDQVAAMIILRDFLSRSTRTT
jgi:putative Holliday junction resolvase